MNLLIVEDDEIMARGLAMNLKDEGYFNTITGTVEEGLNALKEGNFDTVILDINLPDGDGFHFTKTMRRKNIDTPVLVISGRATVTDRVMALTSGADAYLTKPFDQQELLATLNALIRRANGHSDNCIVTGSIVLNLSRQEVTIKGRHLNLTSKEYRTLELLSLRKGTTLDKSHFINHLYGGIDEPESKIIDVFICKLRRKLASVTGGQDYIHTVWGQGYVLRAPSTRSRQR